MKKRIVSFLMALVMAVSLLPVSAFAVVDASSLTFTDESGKTHVATLDETIKKVQFSIIGDSGPIVADIAIAKGLFVVKAPLNNTLIEDGGNEWLTALGSSPSYVNNGTNFTSKFLQDCAAEVAYAIEGYTPPKGATIAIVFSEDYSNTWESADYALLFQLTAASVDSDKTALAEAINNAPANGYFTENDRYNGKKSSTITNKNSGFWAVYQAALTKAKTVNEDISSTQKQVDAAVAALQAAMANLIPTTQVNPTILYETLNRYTGVFYENSTSYTPDTWAAFDAARTAGHALLDGLFDENGNATAANTAEKQGEIDAAAATLTKAAENLYYNGNVETNKKTIEQINTFLPDVIALADTVKESDYTAESWAAFAAALTAARNAKAPVLTETKADDAPVAAYKKAYEDLYQQFYYGLTPEGEITVSLTYLDPERARQGDGAGSRAGAAQQVKLSGDYSLYAAVDSLKNKPDRFIIWPNAKIFINGVYVTEWYLKQESWDYQSNKVSQKLRLHPGDTVVVDLNLDPQSELQPTTSGSSAQLWQYIDSIKTSQFVQSNGLEVKAGEPFTLTVQQAKAALGRSRAVEAGANMTLFISDMAETPSDNHPTAKQLTQNEKAVITDADGSASVTLYREGWYLIAAYDLREDEKGNIDNSSDGSCPSYAGKYYSANSGTAIWVHVNTPDDLSAVKNTLQSQLDKAYAAYAENYFRPAVWSELKSAYDTGTAGIKDAATSGGASDAQQTAIETIRKLQNNTTAENKQNLTTFRTELNKLPDDASLLSAGVKSTVDNLIACYEGMSDYQRRQLTGVEQTKYNSIKAFADTHETFPEDKAFKLTVNVVGDTNEVTAALNDMTKYLRENPATQDRGSGGGYGTPIQTEPFCAFTATIPDRTEVTTAAATTNVRFVSGIDYAAYFQTRAEKGTFTVDGAKWSISNKNLQFTTYGYGYTVNGGLTVTIGGEAYEIKSVTYQGIDPGSIKTRTMIAYDDTEYLGKDKYYINMRFEDAAQEFTMPYNDVTVTVTWGPVSENVNTARTAALSRLQTLYNSLGDKAKAAYDDGVKSINAAASVTAVESAYQSAVVAMKKAADNYGKVQVIVENTTYSKKDGAPWDGTLVDTWVDLSADSTMMSCVAAALKTVNASCKGMESGYIASINGLGEFDGNKSAGWMGTLNDWFTNEGFSAFTVKNGNLADGDVIRIMFTLNGYGADLGGTWGDSNTTVKALTVDGAMLTPNFTPGEAGGQYDYTLIINGESASVKLTPTASNKNFQVKTFLNEKVTDSSEGSSFYKRTETIPVKAGDTIYLGCGAKTWLSMNNQAGNKQNSDGTWYALHVVSINTGASYVTDLIAKLPTSLKYETYTRSMNDVAAARAAYEVLAEGEQSKVNLAKLVSLEKQIEGFTAVDAFKVQLAALPEAEKLSVNDREAVDAAEAAYKVLEQKDCLTVAEKEKAETVFAKMAEIKGNVVLAVEKQIDAIGEVTLENEAAVKAAQTAYDALTAEQKQLVNGEKVAALNAAVAKLAELKREKLLAEMGDIYASVGESLQAQVNKSAPIVGSIGGEWLALALARSGRSVPAGYYDNVVQYVKANVNANERLHNSKSTDNSRVILALTAIGKDPTNVGGHNLLKGLDSMSYINKQGINGPVFALIALDSHNYPTFGDVTRDILIDRILSEQVKVDGGWALGGADEKASDVDVTAMTIQALAPYYKTNAKVKTAVDKGLTWLSVHQQEDGGFASWGAVNSESCAQVIVALVALGIDPLTDSRFIKNGITALDALCGYYTQDDTLGKGFAHVKQSSGGYVGGAYNQMATEQAYYALNAYYRFANSQNRLYDMTDVCITHNFGAWTVTKAATCTESGISTRKCSVCGTEETMIVPSLGHSMTATAGKAATCTEAGNSAYWTCSRCHKYFSDAAGKTEIAKDSWIINALDHDVDTRGAVAATCYISGHEADIYCKRCGIVITAGATIPATGKHTYVDGVCTTCGTRNPAGGIKGDDLKVDSKDNTIVTGGGLTIKTDKPVTDEKLAEIKAAVENGSIVITVNNTPILQLTKEDKESDGGKNALMKAGAAASGELKKELDKLAEKLDALRGDSSKKNAQLEKIIDVTVELVKTNAVGSVESVAQLTELPRSVTVTVSITNELYDSLKDKRVCVVRSHTDANGNVTTAELPATLGGTRDNYVLTFQTDRASTFAIVSYAAVSGGRYHYTGGTTTGKVNSSNTGDDSQMTIWLGSAVMAAAAVVVLTYKKKRTSK